MIINKVYIFFVLILHTYQQTCRLSVSLLENSEASIFRRYLYLCVLTYYSKNYITSKYLCCHNFTDIKELKVS